MMWSLIRVTSDMYNLYKQTAEEELLNHTYNILCLRCTKIIAIWFYTKDSFS